MVILQTIGKSLGAVIVSLFSRIKRAGGDGAKLHQYNESGPNICGSFVGKVTEFVGGGLLQFTIKTMVVPEDGLMLARNFFVTTSLIVFLLMKILAVVLSQGTKRFVALIMLVMTLLSCWLMSDKFLLFITFCLLLNIGFQILCNFQAKTIRNKLIWLLVLTLVCYVTIHILQLKEVKDILFCIGKELKRIWCLLASLFHQLSFPVLLW